MYRNLVPCAPDTVAGLPPRARPVLRYRREDFGYLAAFPSGRVAMYDAAVAPLLAAGRSYEDCAPHLLTELAVPVDFRFSAPLLAWLEITRRCNLRCPHCFVEGGLKRGTELTTARIMALLDEWAELGVFSVVVTGGEPTMHPDFVAIVRRAHDLGFTVGIATHGMTMTPRLLDQLPREDVIVSVSLDEAHGQGRPGESDFDAVTRRLLEIREAGFDTSIMTTTTHENTGRLATVVDWAVRHDVSLRSVPFVPMGRGRRHASMRNTVDDVEQVARFWLAEERWERVKDESLGLCTGKVFNFLMTMVFATRRCMSGRGICYVDSSGDVYPCTTCSGARTLCGGNVRVTPFRELWESPHWQIRQITWKDFEQTCAGCPINDDAYFCTGRCPGSSFVYHETHDGCGMTDFLRDSVHRREELFRENVLTEPVVPVRPLEVAP